jgi:hypothetical protein
MPPQDLFEALGAPVLVTAACGVLLTVHAVLLVVFIMRTLSIPGHALAVAYAAVMLGGLQHSPLLAGRPIIVSYAGIFGALYLLSAGVLSLGQHVLRRSRLAPSASRPLSLAVGEPLPPFHGGAAYLDYNATTPIFPEVAAEMGPFTFDHFGNPSSGHAFAQP